MRASALPKTEGLHSLGHSPMNADKSAFPCLQHCDQCHKKTTQINNRYQVATLPKQNPKCEQKSPPLPQRALCADMTVPLLPIACQAPLPLFLFDPFLCNPICLVPLNTSVGGALNLFTVVLTLISLDCYYLLCAYFYK